MSSKRKDKSVEEFKARRKAYQRDYSADPVNRARKNTRARARYADPEVKAKFKLLKECPTTKAYHKAYNADPVNKTRAKALDRDRYRRKCLEAAMADPKLMAKFMAKHGHELDSVKAMLEDANG